MNSANMKVTIPGRSLVVFLALLIVPAFGAQSNKNNAPKPEAQPAARPVPQPQASGNRGNAVSGQRSTQGRNPGSGTTTGAGIGTRTPTGTKTGTGTGIGTPTGTKTGTGTGAGTPTGTKTGTGTGAGTPTGTKTGTRIGIGTPTGTKTGTSSGGGTRPTPVKLPGGGTAILRTTGKIASIDTKTGLHVERSRDGVQKTDSEHNRVRVVTTGAHQGFVQRQYMARNGHTYVSRTYVVNNVTYTRVYNTYNYGGRAYYGYVPLYYYRPVYYGWAYEPWPAPVYYSWGWYGDPWYGPYGYYFAPEPYYPTASLWLTDYLIAENMKLAFEAQQNARAAALAESTSHSSPASAGLDTATKQQIAEEVRQQLAAEKQAASAQSASTSSGGQQPASSDEPPPALDRHHSVFIVSSNLDVSAEDGECTLTPGDVITRIDRKPGPDNAVEVMVNSSKKADCAAASKPRVQVADLQEMHNHFREQIDSGLKMLAENQGKGGLPKAPDTSTTPGEVQAPVPDKDVEAQLQKQQAEADQAEREVAQAAPAGQGGGH
jgi:hypothetical protein